MTYRLRCVRATEAGRVRHVVEFSGKTLSACLCHAIPFLESRSAGDYVTLTRQP